jgi:hypothetical protein
VDKTYLEGGSDERFGFATTRDVKTTRARRNRDINPNVVLEDEPFDFQRDIVEEFFPDFNA